MAVLPQEGPVYAYELSWQLVLEHFGATDYVLLLDHRAFVNVQQVLKTLKELPSSRVLQGYLLEEHAFKDEALRRYLQRRRSAVFPHGMGFPAA